MQGPVSFPEPSADPANPMLFVCMQPTALQLTNFSSAQPPSPHVFRQPRQCRAAAHHALLQPDHLASAGALQPLHAARSLAAIRPLPPSSAALHCLLPIRSRCCALLSWRVDLDETAAGQANQATLAGQATESQSSGARLAVPADHDPATFEVATFSALQAALRGLHGVSLDE